MSRVVLPVPVAPDTAMAIPAATIASSSLAVAMSRAPCSIRSRSSRRRLAKVRMVTTGPSGASGGSTAWKRSPPGRRASTQGRDSSTRSPSGATTRCTRAATAAAEAKRTGARSMVPPRSTQTSAGPLTRTSVTVGSASSGASGPSPVSSSPIERTIADRLAAGRTTPSSTRVSSTAARSPAASVADAPVAASRRWTRATSPGVSPATGPVRLLPVKGALPPPATPLAVRTPRACPVSRGSGDRVCGVMSRPPRRGPPGLPG
jgi:hypothetical protein